LLRQINFYFSFRISMNCSKQLFRKFRANLYGQYANVEAIVPENVGKKAGYYAPEPIVVNCPGSMLSG